jgi:hypothetical protein
MPGKRWPTIEETLQGAREGIIDDTTATTWPDAATVEAMRADLEQFRAKRGAASEPEDQPPRESLPA